jgi:thioredoxin 1
MTIEVDSASFEVEVIESEKPVVVYFSAVWCGPCRAMSPVFNKLAVEFEGKAKFVKVDVDEEAIQDIVQEFDVRGIPTLALVKSGVIIDTSVGARSQAQLAAWLMENL